jgi:hypothetical protein
MRAAILMIALMAGISAAQFEQVEEKLLQCEKACCTANGGAWDGLTQACDINASSGSHTAYTACDNACVEEASRGFEGAGGYRGLCCAPGFMVLAVLGLVFVVPGSGSTEL